MPKAPGGLDAGGLAMMGKMLKLQTGVQKVLARHGLPEEKRADCAEEIVMTLMETIAEISGGSTH